MGVRRITGGGRKVIGKFPSLKTGKMIMWESQLERDYLYLVEFDPDVVSCQEQPLAVRYFNDDDKEFHRYVPDFHLIRKNGKEQIIEVKDEERALSKEYQDIFRRVIPIFHREGYEFLVVTEKQIRIQPRLCNVKLLQRYAKVPIENKHAIVLNRLFSNQKEFALSEVINQLAPRGISSQEVYSLIRHGLLKVDITKKIESNSLVQFALKNEVKAGGAR